jgi:hypothetical protein
MWTCKTEIACKTRSFSTLGRDADRGETAAGAKLASACTYFLTLLCFCVSLSCAVVANPGHDVSCPYGQRREAPDCIEEN